MPGLRHLRLLLVLLLLVLLWLLLLVDLLLLLLNWLLLILHLWLRHLLMQGLSVLVNGNVLNGHLLVLLIRNKASMPKLNTISKQNNDIYLLGNMLRHLLLKSTKNTKVRGQYRYETSSLKVLRIVAEVLQVPLVVRWQKKLKQEVRRYTLSGSY